MIKVRDLSVAYTAKHRPPIAAVRAVSFDIQDNELVGLVGESGCGKSTLGFAMTGILDRRRHSIDGEVLYNGVDVLAMRDEQLRTLRWEKFSVVLQGGMNALNPVVKIKFQFFDGMRAHSSMSKAAMYERMHHLLELVSLDRAVSEMYPHELSGGMKQRVAIALALSLNPELIIMDEPTTALDVVVQHSIVTMLRGLQKRLKFSVLFISHDLGLVLEVATRIFVMYAGQMVEHKPARDILHHAQHPYTQALMNCYADPWSERVTVSGIAGSPPDLSQPVEGCAFESRCPKAWDLCRMVAPLPVQSEGGMVRCHLYNREGKNYGQPQ